MTSKERHLEGADGRVRWAWPIRGGARGGGCAFAAGRGRGVLEGSEIRQGAARLWRSHGSAALGRP